MASPRSPRASKAPPATRAARAEARRTQILDAAERALRDGGIEAVRLQALADEVGLTHPALLHHFRTREGLLAAVFQRASAAMRDELRALLATADPALAPADQRALFVEIFDRVADPRRAPPLAWLLSAQGDPFAGDQSTGLPELAALVHQLRARRDPADAADVEGTRFAVLALTLLMFGDLLMGPSTRRRLGLGDDAATRRRFRGWLADRVLGDPRGPHRRRSP